MPAPAEARPEGVDLDGRPALQAATGERAGDRAGSVVAAAGDVNGDGLDDVLIGAPSADPRGRRDAGAVYLVLGGRAPAMRTNPRRRGLRIDGARAGDGIGVALGGGADVNADGFADIVVGAPGASHAGRRDAGRAYVLFGRAEPRAVDLAGTFDGFVIRGAAEDDAAGSAVAGAGDVNEDGYGDVLVGAPFGGPREDGVIGGDPLGARPGAAYVVFGAPQGGTIDLASLASSGNGIEVGGAGRGARLGAAVADAGHAIVLGAPGADHNERRDSGSAYLLDDRAQAGAVDVGRLADDGARFDGATPGERAGASAAGLGDADGDGVPDIAVGAPRAANGTRWNAGAVYVLSGAAAKRLSLIDGRDRFSGGPDAAGTVVRGAQDGDAAGTSVAAAGDVDRDGRADVLIGAPEADSNCRGGSGSAYVVDGGLGGDLARLQPGDGWRIDGARPGDQLGASVAGAGSAAGANRRPALLLGAPRANPRQRAKAGAAYVVHPEVPRRRLGTVRTRLPLFLRPPGGAASDYGPDLLLPITPTDGPVRDVRVGLYSFRGETFARGGFARLGGRRTLRMRFRRPLRPGGYTLIVSGLGDPRSYCGRKERRWVLRFE